VNVEAKIEAKSLSALAKNLEKLVPDAQKKFMKLAATAIFKDVVQHFEQERGPEEKWKRFKWPDGKVRNTRPTKRGGSKILQDTGRLKGSVVPFVEKESAGARTNLEYAIYHNEGTKKIPQREFAYASDETIGKLEGYLIKEIEAEWSRGAG
jgi:phage gpG-like protein